MPAKQNLAAYIKSLKPERTFRKAVAPQNGNVWNNYSSTKHHDDIEEGALPDFSKVKWESEVTQIYDDKEIAQRPVQTRPPVKFGFEIDCISDEPMTRADIASSLNSHSLNQNPFNAHGPHALTKFQFHPVGYNDRSVNGWWKIKPDYLFMTSKSGQKTKTFQLVSPPMTLSHYNRSLHTISLITSMMKNLSFRTDPCAGMHVHIDVADLSIKELRCVAWNFLRFQKGMDLLIPKDRILQPFEGVLSDNEPNPEILNAKNVQELVELTNPGKLGRFNKLNLTNLTRKVPFRQETIEIRSHHAVLDPQAIASWVELCDTIVDDGVRYATMNASSDEFLAFSKAPSNFQLKNLKKILPKHLHQYYTNRRAAVRYLHNTYDANRVKVLEGRFSGGTDVVPAEIKSVLQDTLVLPSPSGLLTYRHGPLKNISPRSAAMRELFPIQETGSIVRTTETDLNVSGPGEKGEAFVADDPMDPMPVGAPGGGYH
eukprot:TRINITY_DN5179_c2_g1_i1.p1 TRINITY_DN5179_c2_g1~~TRINITY_DN5179_c2_g1_i1.p1  ORF type:complete len:501 (+),score=48.41 TRINITY_DN5179_c2_g1_i1:51-1505(+)